MSKRPRLLITHELVRTLVDPPQDEFETLLWNTAPASEDPISTADAKDVEVLLCSGMENLTGERLSSLPHLRLIVVIAAGMSGIDFDYVRAHDIAVTNAGGLNAPDVADYAVALFLAHRRDILDNDRYVRQDRWPDARRPLGRSVSDDRVGIVGLGNIGRETARRLEPFGCRIAWWGPGLKPEAPWPRHRSLEALARWATTLIVAVAGRPETRGLVTAEVIDALGPDGLIVNVSRGFVIDEPALVSALQAGRLGGAALDVFDREPVRGSDWVDVPGVLMSPHVAGSTHASVRRVSQLALANIRAYFAGGLLREIVV